MKAVQALKNPVIHVCILVFSKLCVCGLYSPRPYHIVVDDAYSFLFCMQESLAKRGNNNGNNNSGGGKNGNNNGNCRGRCANAITGNNNGNNNSGGGKNGKLFLFNTIDACTNRVNISG